MATKRDKHPLTHAQASIRTKKAWVKRHAMMGPRKHSAPPDEDDEGWKSSIPGWTPPSTPEGTDREGELPLDAPEEPTVEDLETARLQLNALREQEFKVSSYDARERRERDLARAAQKQAELKAYFEEKTRSALEKEDPKKDLTELGWKRVTTGYMSGEKSYALDDEGRSFQVHEPGGPQEKKKRKGAGPGYDAPFVWVNEELPGFRVVQGYAARGADRKYRYYVDRPVPKGSLKPAPPILPDRPGGYTVEDEYKSRPDESWTKTHKFNKTQRNRAREAVKEGSYYRGYSLWEGNKGVEPKLVPQEKSDIGIGANKEYVFHTGKWQRTDLGDFEGVEQVDPKLAKLKNPPKIRKQDPYVNSSISVRLQVPTSVYKEEQAKERGVKDLVRTWDPELKMDVPVRIHSGEQRGLPLEQLDVVEPGQSFTALLEKAGIKNIAEIEEDPNDKHNIKIVSTTGTHFNPGQVALAQQVIRGSRYGIAKDEQGRDIFSAETPPMREKIVRTPYAASKPGLPAGEIQDEFTDTPQLYHKTINTHLGRRDPGGELLKDKEGNVIEKDTLGIRVPAGRLGNWAYGDRVGYMHFRDRTDAVGWGTSWRPGEKEVGDFVMAVPKEREKEQLRRAVEAHKTGDSSKLDEYIKEKDPDIDEGSLERMRTELGALSGAAVTSAYYTARKKGKHSFIHSTTRKAIKQAHRVPAIKAFDENHRLTTKFIQAHDAAGLYKFKAGEKYSLAKWRVAHPLRDPAAPENVGVSLRNPYPPVPEGYRHIYYRGIGISPGKFQARELERERKHLERQVKVRKDVKESAFAKPTRNPLRKLDRRLSTHTAQTLINTEEKDIETGLTPLEARIKKHVDKSTEALEESEFPTVHDEAARSISRAEQMEKTLKKAGYSNKERKLIKAKNLKALDNPLIPKDVKLGVLGTAAVGGAAIYAYDKHVQHQVGKGKEPSHPFTKHIPEVIHTPSARLRVTHEYHFPNNAYTSALDLENKKMPIGWRFSIEQKEHRLKNFKDVSNEPYRRGPVVGGIKVKAPVENTGSLAKGIAFERPSPTAGPKNQYGEVRAPRIKIAGHDTGVTLDIGNKERWQDKQHKRKLKSKVKGLDKEEREHMKKREERLLREMGRTYSSETYQQELERKSSIENERLAAKVGVGAGMSSRTVEDYEAERRLGKGGTRDRREYSRRKKYQ